MLFNCERLERTEMVFRNYLFSQVKNKNFMMNNGEVCTAPPLILFNISYSPFLSCWSLSVGVILCPCISPPCLLFSYFFDTLRVTVAKKGGSVGFCPFES